MAGYIGSGASVVSSGAENKKVFDITTNTTSLTGLNYTVGKVHVYHNGVRLVDGTDYTATNSTSITLTVAAVSGDQVVVVSYASYQVALSGIDDQSNATALTIDSDENVMVGVASVQTQSGTTAGTSLYGGDNAGLITAGRNGDILRLNRQSSDGDIALFKKDGTTVGSIGTQGSRLSIGSGDVNLNFNASANSMYPISDPAAGTLSSGIVDLGAALATFKDAYLSGGVYLGGTGSANKLSDVETGTWTPTDYLGNALGLNSGTSAQTYTKIGRQVILNFDVSGTGSTSGAQIRGLPFTAPSSVGNAGNLIQGYAAGGMPANTGGHVYINAVYLYDGSTAVSWTSGRRLIGTIVYIV